MHVEIASLPTRGTAPGGSRDRLYARRRPEQSVLYGVVQAEIESFLAHARARERGVPRFVERELRAFLACGILAHGFVRVRCDACARERLVAFSCKGRGFCPACGGRRMADTAAHLVDRVLPEAPMRQWVLSLPFALRYRLAYDGSLTSALLGLFVRTVFASLRRRARLRGRRRHAQCGAVTFVQRFGDALNLNVHFHSLVLDGVYARKPDGRLRFHPLAPPSDAEIERVARQLACRIERLLAHRGLGPEADASEADPVLGDQPLLAMLYAASVAGRVATGRRAGRRTMRVGDRIDAGAIATLEGERCASVSGVSLHANVAVPARDRKRLERLCRYAARPPVATDRLSRMEDGRLLYRLKHRWRDGTTHVVFEPRELLEKLAALVPPPRLHLVRYHGILGPCASERDRVVPEACEASADSARSDCPAHAHGKRAEPASDSLHSGVALAEERTAAPGEPGERSTVDIEERLPALPAPHPAANPPRPRRLAWADLLRRVFAIDVRRCPDCGGRMRILATLHPPEATQAILACLGLPVRAPPALPARSDDDLEATAEAWSYEPDPDA